MNQTDIKKIKMSVVVPTHGRVDLFQETMKSLYEQTTRAFEVIVTDDSPEEFDRTKIKQITEDYANKGLDIKYVFTKPNLLQAPNTNQGLKNASGDYIRILHSDDIISPNCIKIEIETFEAHKNVDFFYHNPIVFDKKCNFCFRNTKEFMTIHPKKWLDSRIFVETTVPSCLCFRKELFERIGGLNEKYKFVCDWDLFFKFLLDSYENKKITGIISKGNVGWRSHENSTTGQMQLIHFYEHKDLIAEMVKTYQSKKILTPRKLNFNIKKAEAYRYDRIQKEYYQTKSFELPQIPFKYSWQRTLKIKKGLDELQKHKKIFIYQFLNGLKSFKEIFIMFLLSIGIIISTIINFNRLFKKSRH